MMICDDCLSGSLGAEFGRGKYVWMEKDFMNGNLVV